MEELLPCGGMTTVDRNRGTEREDFSFGDTSGRDRGQAGTAIAVEELGLDAAGGKCYKM